MPPLTPKKVRQCRFPEEGDLVVTTVTSESGDQIIEAMVTNNNRSKGLEKGIIDKAGHHHHEHEHVELEASSVAFRHENFIKPANSNYIYMRSGSFDVVWPNVFVYAIACILHFYGLWLMLHPSYWSMTNAYSIMMCYWVGMAGAMGITAGAHRLWSHRSYQAALPLRIFLMIGQCIAGQNSLYVWCRDHRVHHKFSETDGDPHNTNRGFFFAHVGWLLRRKHPEVTIQSSKLNFDDLMADPVVRFQHKHYFILYLIFAFIGPSLIPYYVFGETLFRSFMIVYIVRYMTALHCTWFVNSTAHMFGLTPYDHRIQPRENYWVSAGAAGEGYHNYHHTFPFDYKTSENGCKLNISKHFIDLMAVLGLAYKLRSVPQYLIDSRKQKIALTTQKA